MSGVAGLVDEAHDVERSGVDGALGMILDIANQVHAVGKLTAGRYVGENNVPGK